MNSNTLTLVAIIKIVAGVARIFNKFGALMSLILMSVSVNAVRFHFSLDPGNMAGALIIPILNVLALLVYKDIYQALFR